MTSPVKAYFINSSSSSNNKPLDRLQTRIAQIEQSILIQRKLESKPSDFEIDIRSEFYANHNHFKRKQFFDKYKGEARKNIQENFYDFLTKTKQNIHFFDWYESQTLQESSTNPVQTISIPASIYIYIYIYIYI